MKRLIALLLVLVMIFTLAACNKEEEKNPTTEPDETVEDTNPTDPRGTEPEGTDPDPQDPPAELGDVAMGISIADVNALLTMFGAEDPGLDMKNLYYQFGASEEAVLVSLGAQLLGRQHDVHLFAGEALILSAPSLLRENYGISVETLEALINEFNEGFVGGVTGGAYQVDPELAAGLVSKYYTVLVEELKKSADVEVTSNGSNSVINGTLSSDSLAVIVVELVEELCQDDDFVTLMAASAGVTPEEFKESFLEGKPEKEELLAEYKDGFAQFKVALEIANLELTQENAPVSGALKLTLNQDIDGGHRPAEFSLAFDTNAGTFSTYLLDEGTELFGVEVGNGVLDARFDVDGESAHLYVALNDNGITGKLEMYEETVCELEVAVSETELNIKVVMVRTELVVNVQNGNDTIVGTLTMDGEEMGKVTFEKTVEGSKTTLMLTTLEISGATVDFTDAGICLYIDTDADLPAVPTYRDISQMTEEDLNTILDHFVEDNQDLVDWFNNAFYGTAEPMPAQAVA